MRIASLHKFALLQNLISVFDVLPIHSAIYNDPVTGQRRS